jgi:hypothetical protein
MDLARWLRKYASLRKDSKRNAKEFHMGARMRSPIVFKESGNLTVFPVELIS